MTGANQCAECGGPAPHRMLCAKCMPLYGERFTDDVDPADPARAADEGDAAHG